MPGKMELTGSDICCLPRMDCMTDARGGGIPGHAALASGSAGVRAPLELSPPADSRKPINFKHRLIIWAVIANQMDPSFWLECTLFLFTPNKRPLPFLLLFSLCNLPPPPQPSF